MKFRRSTFEDYIKLHFSEPINWCKIVLPKFVTSNSVLNCLKKSSGMSSIFYGLPSQRQPMQKLRRPSLGFWISEAECNCKKNWIPSIVYAMTSKETDAKKSLKDSSKRVYWIVQEIFCCLLHLLSTNSQRQQMQKKKFG